MSEEAERRAEEEEGLDLGLPREPRLEKEGSGETSPPSERVLPLKGESTESDLEEEDEEDEAIELKEGDDDGPYGQVRTTDTIMSVCELPLWTGESY